MIQITDKSKCCGCNACGDVCAHGAITFKADIEGFWYPVVDKERCVGCGLCEKVCPELHIDELKKNDNNPPVTIAAINKNMRVRWDSTSGGAFSALAEVMYGMGGYVSGAVYDDNFLVHNYISNNPGDLARLRSSKYLQSNAEGLYKEIRELLRKGEKVLACGTPCQMAALRSFLHKDYENLIIVDFICRGVNSPKVYRKYLDSLERKYSGKVVYVKAKNKELGWRNLTRKVVFDNGKVYYGVRMDDDFRRGYHTNVFCRPSCYACRYKGFPRMADITIADYWGIEKVDKNLDNNIGTSMILLNSKKGERYFELAKQKMEWEQTDFESILPGNVALRLPIEPAKIDRRQFFEDLEDAEERMSRQLSSALARERESFCWCTVSSSLARVSVTRRGTTVVTLRRVSSSQICVTNASRAFSFFSICACSAFLLSLRMALLAIIFWMFSFVISGPTSRACASSHSRTGARHALSVARLRRTCCMGDMMKRLVGWTALVP